jgi:hypothetical protein
MSDVDETILWIFTMGFICGALVMVIVGLLV